MEVNLSIEAFELTREGIKASLEMMQEMFDEIDKEWIAYEYRPFRKFLGTISSYECFGKGMQHVTLETQQGEFMFPVYGLGEQVSSFLNESYDTVRHQRYDYGINTEVVAQVDSNGYLRSLDWLRKWDIDAPRKWVITDDESFQCRCIICEEDKVCEFVEILETAPHESSILEEEQYGSDNMDHSRRLR